MTDLLHLLDWASVGLLSISLLIGLGNFLFAPRLSAIGERPGRKSVSLLIPARNEAANLSATLPALENLPDEISILILDDDSEDDTARIAGDAARRCGNIRVVPGRPLPAGWMGKNWACHQLSELADSEILIFCDADVTVSRQAIAATAACLGSRCDVLTALPRHLDKGWLTAAVVPLVTQAPIFALLPLYLVRRTPYPSLAAGNGQWLAFTREAYHTVGGHASVRSRVAEDLALARATKEHGLRLEVALAGDLLGVRMYRGAHEMVEGFTKNLFALLGGKLWGVGLGLILLYLLALHPILMAVRGASWLPIAMLLALRSLESIAFRNRPWTILLHPVAVLAVALLSLRSWAVAKSGTATWRGRPI